MGSTTPGLVQLSTTTPPAAQTVSLRARSSSRSQALRVAAILAVFSNAATGRSKTSKAALTQALVPRGKLATPAPVPMLLMRFKPTQAGPQKAGENPGPNARQQSRPSSQFRQQTDNCKPVTSSSATATPALQTPPPPKAPSNPNLRLTIAMPKHPPGVLGPGRIGGGGGWASGPVCAEAAGGQQRIACCDGPSLQDVNVCTLRAFAC